MSAKLELNALSTLVALVEERSVTRAAARLDMTQSGTSHALRRLRGHFDDPLLVRGKAGMQPTPRALEVYERAQRILAELDALTRGTIPFEPAEATRMFTIAADDNMSLHLLPPLVATLTERAPHVDVQVAPRPSDSRQALEQGTVDLLIGTREPDQPGLFTRKLLVDRYIGVARLEHPTIGQRPSLERYAAHSHAIVAAPLPARSVVDARLAEQGLRRRVALRLPHFIACARVVATTDLITATSKRLVEALADPRLRTFRLPLELPSVTIYETWHERTHTDPGHQWLRKLVVEVAQR